MIFPRDSGECLVPQIRCNVYIYTYRFINFLFDASPSDELEKITFAGVREVVASSLSAQWRLNGRPLIFKALSTIVCCDGPRGFRGALKWAPYVERGDRLLFQSRVGSRYGFLLLFKVNEIWQHLKRFSTYEEKNMPMMICF